MARHNASEGDAGAGTERGSNQRRSAKPASANPVGKGATRAAQSGEETVAPTGQDSQQSEETSTAAPTAPASGSALRIESLVVEAAGAAARAGESTGGPASSMGGSSRVQDTAHLVGNNGGNNRFMSTSDKSMNVAAVPGLSNESVTLLLTTSPAAAATTGAATAATSVPTAISTGPSGRRSDGRYHSPAHTRARSHAPRPGGPSPSLTGSTAPAASAAGETPAAATAAPSPSVSSDAEAPVAAVRNNNGLRHQPPAVPPASNNHDSDDFGSAAAPTGRQEQVPPPSLNQDVNDFGGANSRNTSQSYHSSTNGTASTTTKGGRGGRGRGRWGRGRGGRGNRGGRGGRWTAGRVRGEDGGSTGEGEETTTTAKGEGNRRRVADADEAARTESLKDIQSRMQQVRSLSCNLLVAFKWNANVEFDVTIFVPLLLFRRAGVT